MRRNDTLQMTKEELMIRDAIIAIEKMGADARLTTAQMLLTEAQNILADFIEGINPDEIAKEAK